MSTLAQHMTPTQKRASLHYHNQLTTMHTRLVKAYKQKVITPHHLPLADSWGVGRPQACNYRFGRFLASCTSLAVLPAAPTTRPACPRELGREPFLPFPEVFFSIRPDDGLCGLV